MEDSNNRVTKFGEAVATGSILFILLPCAVLPFVVLSVLVVAKLINDVIPIHILGEIAGYGPKYLDSGMRISTEFLLMLSVALHFIGVTFAWIGSSRVQVLGIYSLDGRNKGRIYHILVSIWLIIVTLIFSGVFLSMIGVDIFK